MQQELIEMLEEIIPYVEVWRKEDQCVLDKAEALVEKAKKNNNVPAGPVYQLAKLGGPTETAWIDVTQEVYEDAGFYKDDFKRRILSATPAATEQAVPSGEVVAWMVYGNYTRQPFGMLCSAEAYMRGLLKSDPDGGYHIRPLYYTTPAPAPAQEIDKSVADAEIKAMYVESQGSDKGWLGIEGSYFIGGVVAARRQKKATKPAQDVGLTNHQFDLICQALDKADTVTMEGDYMLDSDDCIAVVRVMQVLFDIAALRAKEKK